MGNSQGLVGAAGVIGYDFGSDSTLEMLSYRKPSMFGLKRNIDEEGVKRMQQKTSPDTFSSYDEQRRSRNDISARSGSGSVWNTRRECTLCNASMMIKTEKSAGYMIFQSDSGIRPDAAANGNLIAYRKITQCASHARFFVYGTRYRAICSQNIKDYMTSL